MGNKTQTPAVTTKAEVSFQPNGAILINRNHRGSKSYWPTEASRSRVEEVIYNSGVFVRSNKYFYRA